ncbi:hypothetical protein [Nostoc sp.]|uniref:hypothetical protein n=1 Tax=Nostoc sp. TaxID=1180 RepID=UPI002FFC281D
MRQLKKLKNILEVEKLSPTSETKIKNLHHLGIVAGLIDEIGITLFNHSHQIIKPNFLRYETFDQKSMINSIVLENKGFNPLPI